MKKYPLHRPPHSFIDNHSFFISLTTYQKKKLLESDVIKNVVRESLMTSVNKYDIKLAAWVILDDHIHFLITIDDAKNLPNFIRRFLSRSSVMINKIRGTSGKQNFYQYREKLIHDDRGYYTRLNYIHFNPVHHGYVVKPAEYIFSSYRNYLEEAGIEWLSELLSSYPLNKERYSDSAFD